MTAEPDALTAEPDAVTAEPDAVTAGPDAVTAGDYADEIPSSPRIKRWEVLNQYLRSSNYCVIIITNVIFLSIGPDVQIPKKYQWNFLTSRAEM